MGKTNKEKIAQYAQELERTNLKLKDTQIALGSVQRYSEYTQRKLNRKSSLYLLMGLILTPLALGWNTIAQFLLLQYSPGWGPMQIVAVVIGLFLIVMGLL